jgi:hypothetical protein
MRAIWPSFTLVEYLLLLGAVILLPEPVNVIVVAGAIIAKVCLQVAISALPPKYQEWF